MAVPLLILFCALVLETALAIAAIIGIVSQYPYGTPDGAGGAGIVMMVALMIVFWLGSIAVYVKKSSRYKASSVLLEARAKAAQILAEASDRALALCSLDGGRCRQCGNPRTGRFCPKCGGEGEGTAGDAVAKAPVQQGAAA